MRKIFLKFGISLKDAELGHFTLLFFKNRQRNEQREEPITRSLHLPYKPLESTLPDEKLFTEIFFPENLSRQHALMRNNQSTSQSAAQSC